MRKQANSWISDRRLLWVFNLGQLIRLRLWLNIRFRLFFNFAFRLFVNITFRFGFDFDFAFRFLFNFFELFPLMQLPDGGGRESFLLLLTRHVLKCCLELGSVWENSPHLRQLTPLDDLNSFPVSQPCTNWRLYILQVVSQSERRYPNSRKSSLPLSESTLERSVLFPLLPQELSFGSFLDAMCADSSSHPQENHFEKAEGDEAEDSEPEVVSNEPVIISNI